MNGNSTEQARPTLPSFADMSSAQRSASMDATVAQVNALTRQVNALTKVTDSQLSREKDYNALTGALGSKVADIELRSQFLDSSFKARLAWLFTGRW
jgi:hypothetical protein